MDVEKQEHEIKETLRRAKNTGDKAGNARRNALVQLIELSGSPHSPLKTISATWIPQFFHFPDLEEAAINAIYDLCEDQDVVVRIAGYKAISRVSRASLQFVKRNTDVLLQLYQSDDPAEVDVIRSELLDHITIDALVTIGVLCDQLVSSPEPTDLEEQSTRERLRSLVMELMTHSKFSIILKTNNLSEDVKTTLMDSLVAVLPKLPIKEVRVLVEKTLPSLSFVTPKYWTLVIRGLCAKVDVLHLDAASLDYLNLASTIVITHKFAPSRELLTFYRSSGLTSLDTLQKLPPKDAVFIIARVTEILSACSSTDKTDVGELSSSLLERLHTLISLSEPPADIRKSLLVLLQLLFQLKQDGWQVPGNIQTLLRLLQDDFSKDASEPDVKVVIRSLLASPQVNAAQSSAREIIKTKLLPPSLLEPLPKKPASFTVNPNSQVPSSKHQVTQDVSTARPNKRRKSDPPERPLLNRIATSSARSGGSRDSFSSVRNGNPSLGGISIKGAAERKEPVEEHRSRSTSLLDRIRQSQQNQDGADKRKRRRGKVT